jgi:hypothetical protein
MPHHSLIFCRLHTSSDASRGQYLSSSISNPIHLVTPGSDKAENGRREDLCGLEKKIKREKFGPYRHIFGVCHAVVVSLFRFTVIG